MSVRSVAIGCAALATVMLIPGPASAAKDASRSCAQPEAERTYTPQSMRYRMSIDLSGCSWWEGTPIQMSAAIERITTGGSDGVGSGTGCGVSSRRGRANPTCAVDVTLAHQRFEAVRYQGSITYPGPDGDTTVGFSAVCISTMVLARCVDMGDD